MNIAPIWRTIQGVPFYKIEHIIPILQKISDKEWKWYKNDQLKYVTLCIDTRDGGITAIKDRDGNYVTVEQLVTQHGENK